MKEWKPTDVNLTKKFNRTPDAEIRRPVSKGELDALESQRQPLSLQHDMPGPPGIAVQSKTKVNRELEDRIKYIHERLGAKRGKARDDHSRTHFIQ